MPLDSENGPSLLSKSLKSFSQLCRLLYKYLIGDQLEKILALELSGGWVDSMTPLEIIEKILWPN